MSNSWNGSLDQQQGDLQNPLRLDEEQLNFAIPGSSTQVRSISAQAGSTNAGDWREEVCQKINAMKDVYYADLNEMYEKISSKLLQHEFFPEQPKTDQLKKLKLLKPLLERVMQFLQTRKNNISISHRDKLPSVEKQIVSLVNLQRSRKPMTAMQEGQILAPQLESMQQPGQSHSQNTLSNALSSHFAAWSRNPSHPVECLLMDSNDGRPSQAEPLPSMDVGDWRSQLLPDSRQKIINKILESLRRHLPVSGEEGLQELRKIAVCFEGKIYDVAASESDYLRKIASKMLTMETKSQTSSASSSLIPSPATWAPGSGGERQQELERRADKIEQDMRAAVRSQRDYIQKMSILKEALDEFRSHNTLHNALPSNSTDVRKDPWEPEPTQGRWFGDHLLI